MTDMNKGTELNEEHVRQALAMLESQGWSFKPPEPNDAGKKKIRLVFYGDAPSVATGFGKVSSNLLPYLHNTGDYEIYCFGVNYMGVPHPYPFQIYPMLPNPQGDPYGREKIQQILPQMDFDILFLLQDSFIMTFLPNVVNELKKRGKNFKSVAYFPIDGPPWREWIESMSFADVPITYTEWGRRECAKVFPDITNRLQVIPHGINLKEFYPVSQEERARLRKFYFGPHAGKFIVINVNRNQQRKDIPRCMVAFNEFHKECPNSLLYLHMAEKDVGWDLLRVADYLGLKVGEEVIFPKNFNVNAGFPVQVVNELYNCADACVSTTQGGGWELSSVEGMATKVPCIFPDNTALTEIFSDNRGFLCRSGGTPNMYHVQTMDNEVFRPLCNINDMAKYLKRLYDKPEIGRRMADHAYDWVTGSLVWDRDINPRFDKIFKDLYAEMNKPVTVTDEAAVKSDSWLKGEVI
jgi:glycosyltransferase involved in cell wall biosynthesis